MKLMMRAIIDLPSKNTAWGNAFNFRQLSYQLTELHLGKNLYQKWIFIEIVSSWVMISWYLWQCFISTMFNSYLVFGLRWSWNRGLSFQCRRQLSTILKDSLWSSSLSSSMSSLWQPCTSLEGELGCQTLPRKYFYASSANISSKVQQNIFVIVTRNTFIKEVRTILKRRKRADLVVQFLATEAH